MTSRKEKPIIEVKNLSKEYRIGMDRTYKRFTESFTNAVRHPIRTLRGLTEPKDTFWALKDINFEVERGEVLGIIGRNGAGKSTLLKILSRITYPTEGEIVMRGRVGSLLEVGTGFHPELTGRENIYFNGAILGMKKREIEEKFDEIVKFSGVEKFLDTPVKRYSSGMQVRLAFSVAAHLDPEILLVDEVLAVGDAEFQKKCLGKMGEVASEGRTVLFVSHNLGAIQGLCSRVIVLNSGRALGSYSTSRGIEIYLNSVQKSASDVPIQNRTDRKGTGECRIIDAWISAADGTRLEEIPLDQQGIAIHINIQKFCEDQEGWIAIGIYNQLNQCILWLDSRAACNKITLKTGQNDIVCSLTPGFALAQDTYSINIAIFNNIEMMDYVPYAFTFNVVDGDFYGTGRGSGGNPLIYAQQEWYVQ